MQYFMTVYTKKAIIREQEEERRKFEVIEKKNKKEFEAKTSAKKTALMIKATTIT